MAGRPTKLTPDVQELIVDGINAGLTYWMTCARAGVTYATFYNWLEKVVKEDGSIAARNVIARLGKGELRTDAALREQVLDVLVVHRHLIPTARRGHYMMVVPHD